jgi:inorganic pyrophosphatase
MKAEDFLHKILMVKIDRPLGSKHPRTGLRYPVNYGYVAGVAAPDGEDLDAYVLGVFEPVDRFQGHCIAVIRRIHDDDDKLIVVEPGKNYSNDQIRALTEFQERFFASTIIRRSQPMSHLTFSELLNQTFQLYKAEEYAQALDLVTREFPRFAEQAHRLYHLRACLACRTGQTQQALVLLEEAVEAGYWYNEQQLREDEDLDPLQGLPRFEELVEVCLGQQAAAQAQATPYLTTQEPVGTSPTDGPPWPLLLTLHGNNSTAEVAAEHWSAATSLGWLVALPQSSQVVGPEAFGWNDWDWARDEIQSHDVALRERHSLDGKRVVLGGFSMGGGLAVWLTLTGAVKARGFIVVGPYVPNMDQLIASIEPDAVGMLRGYIIVGEEDEVCYEISLSLAEVLSAQGIPCELEIHPELAHEHPPGFEKSLARALEFILQS